MNPTNQHHHDQAQLHTRRLFLRDGIAGVGAYWLASQTADAASRPSVARDLSRPLEELASPLPATAKRVIFLHMSGAPSQLEMFSHKPELSRLDGQDCPAEFLEGKRFAFIQGVPKLMGSVYPFEQDPKTGQWISDRLPHFKTVLDKVTLVHTMQTEQFNHAPAQLLFYTGNSNLGYASMGSWITYGLGSENQSLPGFVVLVSGGAYPSAGKGAWGSGFLPSVYQGVQCRSQGDPVLYLSDPPGINRATRRRIIEAINQVNQQTHQEFGDPETVTRIAQYEMAFRMQMSATDAMDLSQESKSTLDLYGAEPGKETFANNCLLARRLSERGVRFVQLFEWGWDSHGSSKREALNIGFKNKCKDVDQAMTALLVDLDQRGLLDETLVVFASEFGRTPMRENRGGREMRFKGRDHHPLAYTMWMAGGGIKRGHSHGETDPIGYNPLTRPVITRDFQATVLRLLGLDHKRLTYPSQGLDQKLPGVKPARVVEDLIA